MSAPAAVQQGLFSGVNDGVLVCCGEPMDPEIRVIDGREIAGLKCYQCGGAIFVLDTPQEIARRVHA